MTAPLDLCIFVWGRPGSNRGPLRQRQFLTVRPAKTVKKVAKWSKALFRSGLKIAISWLKKLYLFNLSCYSVGTQQLYNVLFQYKCQNPNVTGHRVPRVILTFDISNTKKVNIFDTRIYVQIMLYIQFLPVSAPPKLIF